MSKRREDLRVTFNCHNCNKEFRVLKSDIARRNNAGYFNLYCSNQCKFTKSNETKVTKAGFGSFRERDVDRFWAKVNKSAGQGPDGDCWIFAGNDARYVRFRAYKKSYSAHVFSYELHSGATVPKGMQVCHSCDTPKCVNPAHLSVGTPLDNNVDKVSKGRQCRGSNVHCAKINEETAAAIKVRLRNGERIVDIANALNIKDYIVSAIKRGRTWKHVIIR